jgi:UDP-N-acetylglucosamine 3-dehydrogenase
MKSLKLAVIGAGAFGSRYIDSLQSMSGAQLSWVCDLNAELCRSVAERFQIPNVSTDFKHACADSSLDAVIVVTPEGAHREIVVGALEAGKHVIVEKPLATNEEDGRVMLAAARRSGKLLMTGFLLRFDYRYARLQQRLGQIGEIRNIYAYRNFDRSLFELYSRTHSFIENAIHDIDLILWYVRSPVRNVHGFCRNTLGKQNPDVNWGVLEFESGAIAVLQTSWLYPPQKHDLLQWNSGIQVMGEHGVLEVSFDRGGFRSNTEEDGIALLDQTGWAEIHGEPRGAFGAMLRHFLACIRGDTEYHGATPEDAIESMRVAMRLVEASEKQGRKAQA